MKNTDITENQSLYYDDLFRKHGNSVDAVASGLQIFKDLRYEKLCGIFADDPDKEITVHDVGFGLCHLKKYFDEHQSGIKIVYSGSEVTPSFVTYAQEHFGGEFYLRDLSEKSYPEKYDYLFFGGTFYHLAGAKPEEYMDYMLKTLANAFSMCNKGIAFNLITEFVDYQLDDLFYPDISELMRFLVKKISRFITISHNYPLFEHTVFVYHPEWVQKKFPDEAFKKYFRKIPAKENNTDI